MRAGLNSRPAALLRFSGRAELLFKPTRDDRMKPKRFHRKSYHTANSAVAKVVERNVIARPAGGRAVPLRPSQAVLRARRAGGLRLAGPVTRYLATRACARWWRLDHHAF